MKNLFWTFFVLILLAGTSCQEKIDIEAEKQVIRDMLEKVTVAEQQKDVDALMELGFYAEDVIVQCPNMPQIKGLEAIPNFYTEFFKILVTIEAGSLEIIISQAGDMAWVYGWYQSVYKSLDGPIEDEGKYIDIFKKINGEWKCVAASFSSDKPTI